MNDTPADAATQLADGTALHASKLRAGRLPMAFQRVVLAALISGLGDGLRLTALPLLAVRISAKVAVVAAVTAAGTVPWLLFGLFVGALADRMDRRRIMWVTDMVRAVLAAGFVTLLFSGVRDIAVLVTFAFLMGSAQTFFDTASGAFLPAIVPASRLTAANGQLISVQMLTAQLIGPALAGFLTVVALELPFAVDAVSFLAAAALVLTVRSTHRAAAAQSGSASLGSDIVAGLRWLNGRPALRAQSGLFVVLSAVSGAVLAVFVAYARHTLDVGSIGYGLMISIFAAGGILGGLVAPAARAKLGDSTLLVLSVVGACLSLTVLGTLPYAVAAGAALAVLGSSAIIWLVVTTTIRQEVVPDSLLGRITGMYRMLGFGAVPFGALAAGLTAQAIGLPTMFLAAAGLVAVTGLLGRRGLNAASLRAET